LGRSHEVDITIIKALLPSNRLTAFLSAGAVTGLLGVALFGVIHAAIISPIWTSLLGGIPFAVGAGLPIGWAFYELRGGDRLNVGVIRALTFGLLLWATLIPMTLFGVIIRATGIHGQDDAWEVVVELVLTFGTGVAAGRLISGRWRAGLALGTASLALTLAQAGPIPVLNSGRAASLFAALGAVYLVCMIVLGLIASVVSKFFGRLAQQPVGSERRKARMKDEL
jgi:hypothetical protein